MLINDNVLMMMYNDVMIVKMTKDEEWRNMNNDEWWKMMNDYDVKMMCCLCVFLNDVWWVFMHHIILHNDEWRMTNDEMYVSVTHLWTTLLWR